MSCVKSRASRGDATFGRLAGFPAPMIGFFMKLSKLACLLCFSCTAGLARAADIPVDALAGYVGKYPFDVVDGYSFFERPKVIAAVDGAAGPGTADWLDGLDVGTPITLQEDGLISSVCEEHNCSGNNAALAISVSGQLIALCLFSKSGDLGIVPGQVHWIGLNLDRYVEPPEDGGGCPRDADEFLEAYTRVIR
jgi:hypothetical protein